MEWITPDKDVCSIPCTGVGSNPPDGLARFRSLEALRAFNTTKPHGPGTQNDTFRTEFPTKYLLPLYTHSQQTKALTCKTNLLCVH